jgi:hypothetical protein
LPCSSSSSSSASIHQEVGGSGSICISSSDRLVVN